MGKDLPSQNKNGVSIVLCGQAGMGIQTVEHLLTKIFKLAGHNVFSTKEYMSRIRGGTNSTEIRISAYPVRAFLDRIDILVPLNKGAVQHVGERISSEILSVPFLTASISWSLLTKAQYSTSVKESPLRQLFWQKKRISAMILTITGVIV
jgi:hypothetical protein